MPGAKEKKPFGAFDKFKRPEDAPNVTDKGEDGKSPEPNAEGTPPNEKPAEPVKPEGNAPAAPNAIPDKVKPLREAYESTKAQLAEAQAKLKALESSPQVESKVLAEKLTEAEKRAQEYEARLRETDYERSEEYRSQFLKPIEEGYTKLTRAMESWDVTEPDGTVRAATEGDFQALMTMNDRQAKQIARERFGADAPEVLALRASLVDATQKRQEAIKSFKANSEARQKEMTAKQAQAKQQMSQFWESTNKALVEKAPDMFGEGEDEAENNALKEGLGIWDKAYGPGNTPLNERIVHQALVRQSVGFASRAKVKIDKLSSQLKAANEELSKYRKSDPGNGDRATIDNGNAPRNGSSKPFSESLSEARSKLRQ
jgi:hypothetical protein